MEIALLNRMSDGNIRCIFLKVRILFCQVNTEFENETRYFSKRSIEHCDISFANTQLTLARGF